MKHLPLLISAIALAIALVAFLQQSPLAQAGPDGIRRGAAKAGALVWCGNDRHPEPTWWFNRVTNTAPVVSAIYTGGPDPEGMCEIDFGFRAVNSAIALTALTYPESPEKFTPAGANLYRIYVHPQIQRWEGADLHPANGYVYILLY